MLPCGPAGPVLPGSPGRARGGRPRSAPSIALSSRHVWSRTGQRGGCVPRGPQPIPRVGRSRRASFLLASLRAWPVVGDRWRVCAPVEALSVDHLHVPAMRYRGASRFVPGGNRDGTSYFRGARLGQRPLAPKSAMRNTVPGKAHVKIFAFLGSRAMFNVSRSTGLYFLLFCVGLLLTSQAHAFDLNGVWATGADQCSKIFVKKGDRSIFRRVWSRLCRTWK